MIKGALHIHSNISPDSQLSRRSLRDMFKKAGYRFLLTADHAEDLNRDKYEMIKKEYADLSDSEFLIIPGIEVKWKDKVHFLAYGAKNYINNENEMDIKNAIKAIRDKTQCDFLVWGHFSHPRPLADDIAQYAKLVDGIEVFNALYHGLLAPSYEGCRLINNFKKTDHRSIVTGGLDLHQAHGYKNMYCIINDLDVVNRNEIIKSLRNGDFIFKTAFYTLRQPDSAYNGFDLFFSLCTGSAVDLSNRLYIKISNLIKNSGIIEKGK